MSLWTGWKTKPPQGTPLDLTHGLCQGLQYFLPMNEAGGVPIDAKNGIKCTLTGSITWINGLYGPAITFGANSYLTLPTFSSLTWTVFVAYNAATGQGGVTWCKNYNGTSVPLIMDITAADTYYSGAALYQPSTSWTKTTITNNPCDGNWHTAVGSLDGANLNYYQNGALENQAAYTTALDLTNTNPIDLGTYRQDGVYFVGSIAAAAIWSRALSPAEIASFCRNFWQMFASPLPFWWGTQAAAVNPYTLYYPCQSRNHRQSYWN